MIKHFTRSFLNLKITNILCKIKSIKKKFSSKYFLKNSFISGYPNSNSLECKSLMVLFDNFPHNFLMMIFV